MKYFASLIILLIVWAGCTTQGSQGPQLIREVRIEPVDIDIDKIKERGYLVALMDNSSTGLFLYRGETMGYEYDLLKMFCDSVGLDLRIKITVNIEEAFEKLDKGEGDIMAYNLTVTRERKDRIAFTHYHNLVPQVLIQRKPDNWREMKLHEIEAQLIRNPVDLIGQEVYVRYQSSYLDRLKHLSDEIGGDILIVEGFPNEDTEQIIESVANGDINMTVVEEDIAMVNATYYDNLDIETPVSFPQQIAWGVRRNADSLQRVLNDWILSMRKTPEYYTVYNKYFKSNKSSRQRKNSKYSSTGGGELSPYDDMIKLTASELGWDWRLLAAQVFQESKFDHKAKSWAGAIGLMQVLPSTAKEYDIVNLTDPKKNMRAAKEHLLWLQSLWKDEIADSAELPKFVLASYNVGRGHVRDARNLAEKYNANPDNWDEVADYLAKKSKSSYYNDPVCEFGYCRGNEPVEYVKAILSTFDNYKVIYPEVQLADSTLAGS
ncbi:MAG: transporter substrate-binding domain-containing protein [Cyclobacteriaceae bacterium]